MTLSSLLSMKSKKKERKGSALTPGGEEKMEKGGGKGLASLTL